MVGSWASKDNGFITDLPATDKVDWNEEERLSAQAGYYALIIWSPNHGKEFFFDLEKNPRELRNLVDDADRKTEVEDWRERLIRELRGRPEGFFKDGQLVHSPPKWQAKIP